MKTKGIYFLYRVLLAFGLPVVLLYFLFRGIRNKGYWHSLAERIGFVPRTFTQTGPGAIWLHAVSVGEVISCLELLRRLKREFPRSGLFVSTSTLAGNATATEKLRGVADGVFYAPVDYVFAVRRVLRKLRPSVVIIAETELWPNLFREVKRTGAALALVNGRISDRAFPRYRRLAWLFRAVLPQIDRFLVQTADIRDRFVALGAPADRAQVSGNFKFDFDARAAAPESPVMARLAEWKPAKVWIAASTSARAESGDPDEDDVVIAAFQQVARRHPGTLLILVPRKPERFQTIAEKLQAAGLRFVRRTALPSEGETAPQVLLLDTIGELSGLFAAADMVFMGGTLVHRGGHNILEPALFGKPVILGPHMENFQAIADEFLAAQACVEIADGAELADAVERLLSDPSTASEIGERARSCAEARRGATARAIDEIRDLYRRGVPSYRPAMPWFAIAWLLARAWERGAARRRRADSGRCRKLPVPVISVGNLTMGGTGKTPFVLRLAELLRNRSHQPGILTRGYGRHSPQESVTVAPGGALPIEVSGDEPQFFIRSGVAAVGIGANRFDSGRRLVEEFHPSVLLLDDGFQHWKLARDMDIVLIDALEPFGRGDLFPVGRLREPLRAIERAQAIVITRASDSDLAEAIESTVRRWNASAPLFRAMVAPRDWVEYGTGRTFPISQPPFEAAGVFCGLGNPNSFLRTLRSLGVAFDEWIEFDDHHRYRPRDLRHMAHEMAAHGVKALVTTEKDSMNLCESAGEMVAPLSLYWLRIGVRIEDEDRLMREIEKHMGYASH